jgi:RNA polymerase sigma-B factor
MKRTLTTEDREAIDAKIVEYTQTRDRALLEELVAAHVGLARHLANRFAYRGEPIDELEQVALVGILHALERFDPELPPPKLHHRTEPQPAV